jgi:tyrosyl-tRNA synthetase
VGSNPITRAQIHKNMSKNLYDTLKERGFIEQCTNENGLRQLLSKRKITFYIGFDPSASSLHIGHLVSLMAMAWAQKLGHRPIFLAGGGTGLVGDPSGKDKARPLMSRQKIKANLQSIKKQVSRVLDFSKNRALLLDNADWLIKLNYIEFLRDFGVYFSVNRLLTFESIKNRLKKGLSFLEFNYQLLQAYDFWHLFKKYNCLAEMGGSDQWGNIVAGVELIRRLEKKESYGVTFKLIKASTGRKMGKTEKGTVWLDSRLTSPYDYYQYWINTDDKDVKKFLLIFTFLPLTEIKKLGQLKGAEIRKAKEILAFEATKLIHGEEAAKKARITSRGLFGKEKNRATSVPTVFLPKKKIKGGVLVSKLFNIIGLSNSISEARRLIIQGGAYLNEKRLADPNLLVRESDFKNGGIILRSGKKKYCKVKTTS